MSDSVNNPNGFDDEPDDNYEDCWACHGEGGFHDCGEDCCCCLDKDEITETCQECGGTGRLGH